MKKLVKLIFVILIIAIVGYVGSLVYRNYKGEDKKVVFRTTTVEVGDIIRSISATGTVEPEDLINVGAQVTGKVMSFGVDENGNTVNYGSRVKAGSVLANIDDVVYKAEYDESVASVALAEAAIRQAEASLNEAKSNEELANLNWVRAQNLIKSNAMTGLDHDSYKAAYASAVAQTEQATASLAQSNASLAIAKASEIKAKRNLEYCVITTPVDGIIIDRKVSIGQTVVSSQSASNIFLVANDFKKMQVWVSVNEADIGSIEVGMPVIFSCDAFPGVRFEGEVFRVRLNATLSSNVVTYIVEVNVDNTSGQLIPYLTANVNFIRQAFYDVLTVSTAALRYEPEAQYMAVSAPTIAEDEAILWRQAGADKLEPVVVKVGLTSGNMAMIMSPQVKSGDQFATGVDQVAVSSLSSDSSGSNPFMPNMPQRPKGGSAGERDRAAEREQKQQ